MSESVISEGEILERMSRKIDYAQGYFLPKFGFGGRVADAVWLSASKPWLTGFEIKRSRADWLAELRDPWKAHAIGRFCRQWYLVVAKRNVIMPNEVPEGWGLEVIERNSSRILVRAPVRKDVDPWTDELFFELIRAIKSPWKDTPYQEWAKKIHQSAYKEALLDAKKSLARESRDVETSFSRLSASVQEFEKASGISISAYSGGEALGRAVEVVRNMTGRWHVSHVDNFARHLGDMKQMMETLSASLSDMMGARKDAKAVAVRDVESPDRLREIAGLLLRCDEPLRKAAASLEAFQRISDAEIPSRDAGTMAVAQELVRPVARLLGPQPAVALVGRIARALEADSNGAE